MLYLVAKAMAAGVGRRRLGKGAAIEMVWGGRYVQRDENASFA